MRLSTDARSVCAAVTSHTFIKSPHLHSTSTSARQNALLFTIDNRVQCLGNLRSERVTWKPQTGARQSCPDSPLPKRVALLSSLGWRLSRRCICVSCSCPIALRLRFSRTVDLLCRVVDVARSDGRVFQRSRRGSSRCHHHFLRHRHHTYHTAHQTTPSPHFRCHRHLATAADDKVTGPAAFTLSRRSPPFSGPSPQPSHHLINVLV